MGAFFRAVQFASLGLEMGLCVAIGAGIGYFLDSRFGTKPWLLLVFLLLGIAAAFKAVIDAAKRARASNNQTEPPDQNGPDRAEKN
jgi:ATP synthase protein I